MSRGAEDLRERRQQRRANRERESEVDWSLHERGQVGGDQMASARLKLKSSGDLSGHETDDLTSIHQSQRIIVPSTHESC